MPAGIEVTVEDGFATIDIIDRGQRGPALSRLIALAGPGVVETLTRTGPRRMYRVPEGNAREAGLLDFPAKARPTSEWHRTALDAYAAEIGIIDAPKLPNRQAVLDAIHQLEG